MAKLIFHPVYNPEKIELRRLEENLRLTSLERLEKAFMLMRLALLFKKGPIKEPQEKGIVLKRKQDRTT